MSLHTIRPAGKHDAPGLAKAFRELGHTVTTESIERLWHEWAASGNSALVALCQDGDILGIVTLHQMTVLHRPQPVGRITALFVDASARGRGVGRSLMTAAESALAERGCGLIEITSNFRFADAHSFYEHLGYDKTSFRLAKAPPACEVQDR